MDEVGQFRIRYKSLFFSPSFLHLITFYFLCFLTICVWLSCQQPYFREKKHVRMLRNWSARKRNRQKRQQRQRNQCETQHSPHHGLEEATQDTAVSQRQEDATPIETDDNSLSSTSSEYINSRTSVYQGGLSIGIKPIDENDDNLAMPSTSGMSSAQSRTDAGMEIRLNTLYRLL